MTQTLAQQLTERFYAWELNARGWYVYDHPVTPEPPFQSLLSVIPRQKSHDDGRQHTLVSAIFERFVGKSAAIEHLDETPDTDTGEINLDERDSLVRISLAPPQAQDFLKSLHEQFLLNLSQARFPVCLEFAASAGQVSIDLICDESDANTVLSLVQNHFPDVVATPSEITDDEFDRFQSEPLIVEFGLSEESVLPLRTYRSYEPDPLIGIIAALGSVERDESACLSILFEPATHPWGACIRQAVTTPDGKPFFANYPELTKAATEKIAAPLYGVVVRAAASSAHPTRSTDIVRRVAGALSVLDKPDGNQLIPLDNSLYDDTDERYLDLIHRTSRRSGMLWSLDELLSLVHMPGSSVTTPALSRAARRTHRAPDVARGPWTIGKNVHAGNSVAVGLSVTQRLNHTYVIGASGTGKSTLLANMIRQDIAKGQGIGVLDPHGDLIDRVLTDIPEERFDDVVLLDLADEEHPVPFNVLFAHTELEKRLLASDLSAVFQRLATSWGDQMSAVLANAILAFLESDRGGTLSDLRRFLVEKPFREDFLSTVQDPEVVYYWQHEYALLSGKPQGSVVTRLNTFLRPKPIRYMVGHGENRLNVSAMMNEGKIFLARIPQGAIGEENAYLLGTLLVSAFHRAALSRQEKEAGERRPFFLYIDEFHHFITPSMAPILSGARKYGLGLILAHQELRQLESRNSDVASAAQVNPVTRVCFRLGDQDAKKLEAGFAHFNASDLQSLGKGQAIARVERNESDFNLDVPLPPEARDGADGRVAEIRQRSRTQYAVSRSEAEAILAKGRERPEQPTKAPTQKQRPSMKSKPPASQPSTEQPPEKPAGEPEHSPQARKATPSTQHVPKTTPSTPPRVPEAEGRGGLKHKSLQRCIKQWAENHGFRAQIEKPILEGRGAVDVALYKGATSIACEISVTTPTSHECKNLKKCLEADFQTVVMIAHDEAHLTNIKKQAKSVLESTDFAEILFMTPQQLFRYVDELETKQADQAASIRGYKVTVNRSGADPKRRSLRMRSIKRTIAGAVIRKPKGKTDEHEET
jgi:DNA helicase HerA-like ATPase